MTRYLFRATQTSLILLASVASSLTVGARASAQDNPAPILDTVPHASPANTPPRLSVNKDFNLNITDQRISQQNYKASTSIGGGDANDRGISLRVGAVVRASQVDMRLQNINGKVHFHASLERLRQSLRSRNAGSTEPS
jgi:hypothetical protein